VSPCATPGGAERALSSLARQLPGVGFSPICALLAHGEAEQWFRRAGCETHVLSAHRTREVTKAIRTISTIRDLIRATGTSVVVSNQSKGHIYGGIAALAARVPAVFWQQGIPRANALERMAAAIPARAIVCSSDAARAAQSELASQDRVFKIHLGIETGEVCARKGSGKKIKESLGWDSTTPVVGIVGRLERWKGQEDFLRAAAIVARTHRIVNFAVVGGAVLGWEGSYPEELRRLATRLGIKDRVHFAGYQADVYPWFDALDVVVHASDREPFGLVLVEAMALGKPLIATAAGGPTEIIEEGISGLLVPPRNPEHLADAIARVLDDDDLSVKLARGASDRAREFSEERMAERFAEVLTHVTERHRRSSLSTQPPGSTSVPHLEERTVGGLHDFLVDEVVPAYLPGRHRAIDLGAGSGALAIRLQRLGLDVLACDLDEVRYRASTSFVSVDLNDHSFGESLGEFDLVTAIEVIEHLEAPISFLRNVANLLTDDGVAVITTPNVDSLPARVKHLIKGVVRMFDRYGDPTHISPIFWDLLIRQYLPRTGLRLLEHRLYPATGFRAGRPIYRRGLQPFTPIFRRAKLLGDNHVLVLVHAAGGGRIA
jgi:glycosyltransferase involved in cell wall biosynthesis/SAM-dependent methyltransferase